MTTVKTRKKLIEVAIPLEAINKESLARKQKAPKGWPMSFHKYWAQRPLAAARAVVFAQLVDDPSAIPELYPTSESQAIRRAQLLALIEKLVLWDNSHNQSLQAEVRAEIIDSWERHCDDNKDHPDAGTLFRKEFLPVFWDPFAGSGAIPMSAQWLGLQSYGTDLNPVAVVLNKCMIEYPFAFKGRRPISPASVDMLSGEGKNRCAGMAVDLKYYAEQLSLLAFRKIGSAFPDYEVDDRLIDDFPGLKSNKGQNLKTVAWIWARTVKSPNPAYSQIDVPLASTFLVSSKTGREAYIKTEYKDGVVKYKVMYGEGYNRPEVKAGTSAGKRAAFKCCISGVPITYEYIRAEGMAGRMSEVLMAVVVDSSEGRLFLPPNGKQLEALRDIRPPWKPDSPLPSNTRDFKTPIYGLRGYGDLFTKRQLLAHATFSDLLPSVFEKIKTDARVRMTEHEAEAYAKALCVYLACVLDRVIYYGSALVGWLPKDSALGPSMPRQAIPMTWDFTEANPFGKSSGGIINCASAAANYLEVASPNAPGHGQQCDAQTGLNTAGEGVVISTDPPYYDNIGYADLSDFFYVWLKPSLGSILPELFTTLATPKEEELVADAGRKGSAEVAEAFFIDGMTKAMESISARSKTGYPITIYYAFKQSETDSLGTASTGWETFLTAVLKAGLSITGTWPIRTEGVNRMLASGTNALSSSIVLVCRNTPRDLPAITKGVFLNQLKLQMPIALAAMQRACLAPVDIAQASIGPGMEIFCKYSKVIDAAGRSMSVRDVLLAVNQTLDDSIAEQEADLDADTRWCVMWFEKNSFSPSDFGTADVLARAKNTSVEGLTLAGVIKTSGGKVKLLTPDELPPDWNPATDLRLTIWEIVHHIVRSLKVGESLASSIVAKTSNKSDSIIELAYRLFRICESKKEFELAASYNGLIQAWPELLKLSSGVQAGSAAPGELNFDN